MPSLCEHSSSTSRPILQLDNGLVDDILYYEDPRNKWRYFVAKFDKFTDFIIREIDSEDFHSLSGAKWLTGTTVSIILNILSDRSHQVLDDQITKAIFDENYDFPLFETFQIRSNIIVMPINVRGCH